MQTDSERGASIQTRSVLAADIVRKFGEVRMRVFGTSMAPAILPGDLVLVRHATLHEIVTGDVVLFTQNGRLFVHRAVGRKAPLLAAGSEADCLVTRGDRLKNDDPPVSCRELLGRVVSIERDRLKVTINPRGSKGLFPRLMRDSDRITYTYLRLRQAWRSFFPREIKCRA